MQLLVRNKVRDFDIWYRFFREDTDAAASYGITVDRVWRAEDDANDVYFLLNVEDRTRAEAFMARPESAEMGEKSGVIDGEIRYLIEAS